MSAVLIEAARSMGKLHLVHVTDAKPSVRTLREACIARGVNPDATGYKVPSKAHRAIERIIPGVPDRIAPSEVSRVHLGANYHGNARKMYTRTSAANDAAQIAEGGVVAYVAAFCRLNNLKHEVSHG